MKANASLRLIIAAVLGSSVTTAVVADEPKGDLSRLQGSWAAKTGPSDAWTVRMTFKGNEAKISWPTDIATTLELTSEVKVDEKAEPKRLDFIKLRKANGGGVEDSAAIYAIEKDGITLCIAKPGETAPAEFKGSTEERYPSLLLLKPEPAPPEGDLAALQGSWSAKTGPDGTWDVSMTIKGRSYKTIWPKDGTINYEIEGEIRLDEKAEPKRVDFVRQVKSTGEVVKDTAAIYAIEKDGVKLCLARPGTDRPAEFKAGAERYPWLLVLKKK